MAYDVWVNHWYGAAGAAAQIVTYQMTSQRRVVTNFNLGTVISDAEVRGYTSGPTAEQRSYSHNVTILILRVTGHIYGKDDTA